MNPAGVFILWCIEDGWPQTSCEREVLNLFSHDDEDEDELRQYVKDMYEVFDATREGDQRRTDGS